MNKKIWLSSPHMGGTEMKYVQEAYDINWVAPLGPNVNGLEEDLENYLGNQTFIGALNSGTAAIHLGLILLGVKAGDEVICQSMTFSASANPILYLGATPVFIDSEPETWNICPIALEQAIVDRIAKGKIPKAIIAVHLYGVPYKVDQIKAISQKYNIPVLEEKMPDIIAAIPDEIVGTPTLFIRGEKSNYIIEDDFQNIYDQFPSGEIETIYDAGHWVHAENPFSFYNMVMDFSK